MPSVAIFRERLILERLRETYEQQGHEFFPQPTDDILPAFMRDHRPDAIALKPGVGIVIQIKVGNHPGRDKHLASLASVLEGRTDWRLKIYVEQPRPEDSLAIDIPTESQISDGIDESQRLAREGHERAASLVAWSLLEAIARARASGQGLTVQRPISPAGTVQTLEMGGLIDDRVGHDPRQKAQLRNRIAHGDLATEVDPAAVTDLIQQLRELATPMVPPQPDGAAP